MINIFFLKKYFRDKSVFFDENELSSFPGSSGSSVFLFRENIYKVIKKEESEALINLFNRYKRKLKKEYSNFFSDFEVIKSGKTHHIWRMKYNNARDLEVLIFEGLFEDLKNFSKIDKIVYSKIDKIFQKTKYLLSKKEKIILLNDLFAVIKYNLKKSKFNSSEWDKKKNNLFKDMVGGEHIKLASLSHNDVSVGNILIEKRKKISVFFIDPRRCLPQLKTTMKHSNIAYDLIGYYVSIERKCIEQNTENSQKSLELSRKRLNKYINIHLKNKIFSEKFIEVVFLAWYSSYLACPCDYCLSKDKRYLYNIMKEKALLTIKNI